MDTLRCQIKTTLTDFKQSVNMEQSTDGEMIDGEISYGVYVGESDNLPWDHNGWDCEINWWKSVQGFQNTEWCPYTPEGGLKEGVGDYDPRIGAYFNAAVRWLSKNPLPFDLVNASSYELPLWILAVPGSVRTARRGFPVDFQPSDLQVDKEGESRLKGFVEDHLSHLDLDPPIWRLSSCWR